MITYIAGPMSGLPDFNRAAFHKAAAELVESGRSVLNPATLPDGLSEHAYMDIGIAMLRSAEAIYLLDGWEQSAGARAEATLAEKLGLRVYYQTLPRGESNSSQPAAAPVVGWIRADCMSDRRRGNSPIFILNKKNPSAMWGTEYIALGVIQPAAAPVAPDEKRDYDGNTTSEFDHACRAEMLKGGRQ